MTSDQLRSTPEFTNRMSQIFGDPYFAQALVTLKEEGEQEDAEPGDDALASVRILAKQKGRASVFSDLLLLGVPLATESRPLMPDFGTGISQEEIAEAVKPE